MRQLTLEDIEAYAYSQFKKYLNFDWKFAWNERFESTFGQCRSDMTIVLSKRYTLLNINYFHIIRDIILHEIAHAVQFEREGKLSHDKEWKNICKQIGAKPNRQFSIYEVTCPSQKFALRDAIRGIIYEYHDKRVEDYQKYADENFLVDSKLDYIWCGK